MRLWMACAFALSACTSQTSETKPADPPPGSSGGEAEPPPCEEGTYRVSTGECVAFPALTVSRAAVAIAPVRDHHTTMVIETASGPWLYVIGGTQDWVTLHDDVQRAKIGPDGSLGGFESAGKLPDARAGHCTVKVKDRLYVLGGVVRGPTRSSVVLELDADGKVKGSAPGPEIPTAVMHLSCDQYGDNVYVMGGRGTDSRSTKMSARAKIAPDGTLGAFEATTPLSPDRSHHASFVHDKRFYILGGLTGDPTKTYTDHKDVVMADIAEDGTLGEWTAAGALPETISVSAAQLYKDAVYVFGGLEGDGFFTDKIRRATMAPDGTLSAFVTLPTRLPDGRGHVHQTPMYKDWIYSVAGKNNDEKSIGLVDIGRFQ